LFVVLSSSLAVFGGGWGVFVFITLVLLAIGVARRSWLLWGSLVILSLVGSMAWSLSLREAVHEAARRITCGNQLKQIAIVLHSYRQANGCFPPAYIADKNGKPMHSWRVLILPYLGYGALCKAYDFTEPWDGAKNKKLLTACPQLYQCPSDPNANASGATKTSYVAVLGRNAAWVGEKSRKLGPVDFPGSPSNTIMVVEVANSGISWMEPRDLSLDALAAAGAKSPALTVSSNHGEHENFFFTYDHGYGANVATADGSVHYLLPGILATDDMRKTLKVGGYRDRETDWDWDKTIFDEGRYPNWPNIAALAVWLLSVGTLLVRAVRSREARLSTAAGGSVT
jgi:hypothetical protein